MDSVHETLAVVTSIIPQIDDDDIPRLNDEARQRRERRAINISINSMKRRIASLIGIDNRSMDTVEAIIACQREVIRAKNSETTKYEWIHPPAYTLFQVSLETIGRKMALRSAERDSLRKSAGRRCSHLFNVIQPQLGRELVTRIKGEYNAKNPQESEAHTYIDNLTPAADWAYQQFRETIRNERLTAEDKRAVFDGYARMAIDMLPEADLVTVETTETKLNLIEYSDDRKRQILASIERAADKIDIDYKDPLAASRFLLELLQEGHQILRSRRKIHRHISEDHEPLPPPATASSDDGLPAIEEEEEEGSGYNSGTFSPLETTQDAGGGGDILSPPCPDNTLLDNELDCTIPQQFPENNTLTWARRYIKQGWYLVLNYGLTDDGACTCQDGQECKTAGKHPIGGTHRATNDIQEIERRLRQHPRANLGIVTGERSGIYILDFDKAEGRALFRDLSARRFIDGDALIQESGGGGIHYPLQWFSGLSARVGALPGLDIRAENSQVVSAPSLHSSGNRYEWANWGAPVAEASPSFREFLLSIAPKADKQAKAKKEVVRIEDGTQGESLTGQDYYYRDYPSGVRNHALYRVACALRGQTGAKYDDILGELRHRNDKVQSDKLSDREIQRIVRSACRHKREVRVG